MGVGQQQHNCKYTCYMHNFSVPVVSVTRHGPTINTISIHPRDYLVCVPPEATYRNRNKQHRINQIICLSMYEAMSVAPRKIVL